MLNKAMLIGNLGRDAEMKMTRSGTAVATVSLATTQVWRDKEGNKQERTDWHRVVLWGRMAESLSEYLKKGKKIFVEGQIQTRDYENADGKKTYVTEIRADRVVLLDGGGGGGSRGGDRGRRAQPRRDDGEPAHAEVADTGSVDTYDDDVPF